MGTLCSYYGNIFTSREVGWLIDQIVTNREPVVRSGCATALGCIHSQIGGMAAGLHLKNILGILMSLSNDPHPTVHFWALDALSKLADSSGLSFSGYVSSTLGMLAQVYVAESHSDEVASLASSNLETEMPTTPVIGRCIDSIINVLGPDLQDMTKARELIITMIAQFRTEEDQLVSIESLRCLEHMSLYAPGQMEFAAYVKRLQGDLDVDVPQIQDMAIDGLHNLMRRNADEVIQTANPGLEDKIWLTLNALPEHEVARNIIWNWLRQTGLTNTAQWIQRCNVVLTRILTKTANAPQTAEPKPSGAPEIQDEEVAGFNAADGEQSAVSASSQELLRWQVRTFAMDCLIEMISMVAKEASVRDESQAELALQQKVGDVVRIAFSASTAGVVSLRVRGLRIIDQILKVSICVLI